MGENPKVKQWVLISASLPGEPDNAGGPSENNIRIAIIHSRLRYYLLLIPL